MAYMNPRIKKSFFLKVVTDVDSLAFTVIVTKMHLIYRKAFSRHTTCATWFHFLTDSGLLCQTGLNQEPSWLPDELFPVSVPVSCGFCHCSAPLGR